MPSCHHLLFHSVAQMVRNLINITMLCFTAAYHVQQVLPKSCPPKLPLLRPQAVESRPGLIVEHPQVHIPTRQGSTVLHHSVLFSCAFMAVCGGWKLTIITLAIATLMHYIFSLEVKQQLLKRNVEQTLDTARIEVVTLLLFLCKLSAHRPPV